MPARRKAAVQQRTEPENEQSLKVRLKALEDSVNSIFETLEANDSARAAMKKELSQLKAAIG